MTTQPWYDYPRIDNLGQPDPQGGFPKPDSNILVPDGTPMTAPASGTITNINTTSPFGEVITVLFDTPPDSQATHYAFLHLNSIPSALSVGQHVNAGDTLGLSGSNPQNSAPGFALYPGDAYGTDTAWQSFDTIPNLTGSGAFNPVPYLNALSTNSNNPQILTGCQTLCAKQFTVGSDGYNQCIANCIANTSVQQSNPLTPVGNFFSAIGNAASWLGNPVRIIKLVAGFILLAGAIYIMAQPESGLARGISRGLSAPSAHIQKVSRL